MNDKPDRMPNVPPFVKFVASAVPMVFDDSLSYYEALCALWKYVEGMTDVINNNATLEEEYIEKFNELKSFVDNYFENLDVQEEINNKLDEMAEDGTLGQYFQRFVNPVLTSFELEMNEKIETGDSTLNNKIDSVEDTLDAKIDTNVSTLQSQVSGLASGSPLVASSTSGMSDHTKIYVNTTDGKWYYYNGASWVAGGTYQSSSLGADSVGIENLKDGVSKFHLYNLEGKLNAAATRIQVTERPYLRKGSVLRFNIPEGFQWSIVRYWYDPNGHYETVLSWTASTNEYVVEDDGRFEVTFRKTGDLELVDADIATCLSALKCYRIVPNYAGRLLEYYPATGSAFTLTEHYTANGVSTNIRFLSNQTASQATFYMMFDNLVEYTNYKGWSPANTTHHPFRVISYNLESYGTVTETAIPGGSCSQLDITVPHNYALVLNTQTGTMSVKQYSETDPNDAILIRNSSGYCGGGAFKEMLVPQDVRKNTTDIANITTTLAALTTYGNFDINVKGINHRGWNSTAPENTIPAFQESRKHGFNYVETDISWTSDGVPVLLHDNTIDRTSNGTGAIGDMTYDQVSQYDFGSWKSEVYAGTKIPTLDEFLVVCRNLGLHPYLELKPAQSPTEAMIRDIVDRVENNGMKGKVSYISFDATLLGYVKDYDSEARLGYLTPGAINQTYVSRAVALKTEENEVFLDSDAYTQLSPEGIALCQSNDIPLEVWVVDNSSDIINLDSYITGVTSDSLVAGKVLFEDTID